MKYNSFAVVFLIFLYSLATLPGWYVNQGSVIIVLAVVVIGPAIIMNIRLDRQTAFALAFELLLLSVLYIQFVVHPDYSGQIQETIINLLSIGTIGLLVGTFYYNEEYCLKYGLWLSLICMITSLAYLYLARGSMTLSMRFGYALVPSAGFFALYTFKNRSLFSFLLLVFTVACLAIWGSRGTLLVILFFFLLVVLHQRKFWLIVLLLLSILFYSQLSDAIVRLLRFFAEMTGSRKVEGLIALMSSDFWEATSGRDRLYDHCIALFNDNPWGVGVGFWQYDPMMSGLYPHNIFLQVMTELGILGLIAFCIVLMIIIFKLFKTKGNQFYFLAFLFSVSFGRLMVSSNFWARPEFWLLLGVLLFNKKISKQG